MLRTVVTHVCFLKQQSQSLLSAHVLLFPPADRLNFFSYCYCIYYLYLWLEDHYKTHLSRLWLLSCTPRSLQSKDRRNRQVLVEHIWWSPSRLHLPLILLWWSSQIEATQKQPGCWVSQQTSSQWWKSVKRRKGESSADVIENVCHHTCLLKVHSHPALLGITPSIQVC